MPFIDLILFNISNFLLTENVDSIKNALSMCRCYGIDIEEFMVKYFNRRYANKIINILDNYTDSLPFINISMPENALNELIRLRLINFSKHIKPSYKLTPTMNGMVIIKNNSVYIHSGNNELIEYILKEYSPNIYLYVFSKPEKINGSKIILCGYDMVTFFSYTVANIISNKKTDIIVTNNCIKNLSDPINISILINLFDNSNNQINRILRKIFYSLGITGGQIP
ncbi:viral late transcription elongation factor [Cotia virus SPAn232]|uniref:Late transcription elongation factor OPG087 n=2 Tax=Cotia virus TaxID=39444 RepID=H6TA44_9POXV|nr:viral late transcription elongation factor [Cotia virus SPAn232]ADT91083.1 viral late transcription elongation factor [Cotia virus SPAn232]AIT70683.1 viral late transcription elongation factor [Cotia virus]